jgi:hypothetical protein
MTAVREAGLASAIKKSRNGKERGGRPMSPGSVYNILRNPVYVGEIRGHDRTWPGLHRPIIDREIWKSACALVERRKRKAPSSQGTDHFLVGLLWDDLGRHMLLDANWIDGTAYHVYVSSNAQWSQAEYVRAYRTRADRMDGLVCASFAAFLLDRGRLRAALQTHGIFGEDLDRLAPLGAAAECRLAGTPAKELRALFHALFERIEVGSDRVTLHGRPIELVRFLEWDGQGAFVARPADWPTSKARYHVVVPVSVIAPERWPAFAVAPRDESIASKPNKHLIALLRHARSAQALFDSRRDLNLAGLALEFGRTPGYFSRLIRLNYLAPDIVASIRDGTQPSDLDRTKLASAHIPLDWSVQRKLFGFPEPRRVPTSRDLFGRGLWPATAAKRQQDARTDPRKESS